MAIVTLGPTGLTLALPHEQIGESQGAVWTEHMEEFENQEEVPVELEASIDGFATAAVVLVATSGIWPFQGNQSSR